MYGACRLHGFANSPASFIKLLLRRWNKFLLGCPRNNQIFFSVRTETNRNSICFGCFSVCFAKPPKNVFSLFRFVSVFRTSIETTETNRINLQTKLSIRVSSKQLTFFSVRTETKRTSICFGCFSVCFFRETKQKYFCFVSVFRTGIETIETIRTYGMGNETGLYFNKFPVVSIGLLFVSVVSKHRNSLFRY
jgi:hypothetical protein